MSIIKLQDYKQQKELYGISQADLQRIDRYHLILQFIKRTKELRKDPHNKELMAWVRKVSYWVTKRCSNKDLVNEAQLILDKGILKS